MTPRALRILLICSLVLNIFIVGGLAGAALSWKRTEARQPFAAIGAAIGRPGRIRQAAMNLSPEYRRALRQRIGQLGPELRPLREQARAAREETGRLLTAPTLDLKALDAAMARVRASDIAIRTRLETEVATFAASLPASERTVLTEALAAPPLRPQPGPPQPPRPFPGGRP